MNTARFVPVGVFGVCFGAVSLAAAAGSSNSPNPNVAQKTNVENAKQVSVEHSAQTDNTGSGSGSEMQKTPSKPNECPGAQYDGKPFEEWKQKSQDLDPTSREQAIRALGHFASANLCARPSISAIIDCLRRDKLDKNDPNDKKILDAANWAFLRIGVPAVDQLTDLLADASASVEMRRFAAETLGVLLAKGSPPITAIQALTQIVKSIDLDFWLRWTAFQSLQSALSNEKDKDVLIATAIDVLQDTEVAIRRLAAEVLGAIGPEAHRAVDPLLAALKAVTELSKPDSTKATVFRVRLSLLKALGDIHSQPTVTLPRLIAVLKQSPVGDQNERIAAIVAIGQFRDNADDTSVTALIEAFKNTQLASYAPDLSDVRRSSQ